MPLGACIAFEQLHAVHDLGSLGGEVLGTHEEFDFDLSEPAQVLPFAGALVRTHLVRAKRLGLDW